MGTELTLNLGTLYAFVLVLTRVSGAFIFVPLPGIQAGPELSRAALATSITLALYARWPMIDGATIGFGQFVAWIFAEAGLGLAIGICVAVLSEIFQMGSQILGLQAGYSFASTIDPTSGADSGILISLSQTAAGLLFFVSGLDHQVLRAFSRSLSAHPPGQFVLTQSLMQQVLSLGSMIFSTGFRLVLPIVGLLIMVDVSLALLARLNAQLQLITLAFPIKMLVTLALLAWLALVFPRMFSQSSVTVMRTVQHILE